MTNIFIRETGVLDAYFACLTKGEGCFVYLTLNNFSGKQEQFIKNGDKYNNKNIQIIIIDHYHSVCYTI